MQRRLLAVAGLVLIIAGMPRPSAAQVVQPLGPARSSGQTVTPVFEGWYKNADGTFSLSFGFFNRNTKEELDIPVGANNFMSPGTQDQGQPTHFGVQRAYGAFVVKVPANFGDKKLVWTLINHGQTFSIPGSLKALWQIDALEGEVGSNNTPPVVSFDSGRTVGRGPGGIATGPLTVKVGTPLNVVAWVTDDGRSRAATAATAAAGRGGAAATPAVAPGVTLAWLLHQGPGQVTFSAPIPRPDPATGKVTTTATFTKAGDYTLRLRANDASGVSGGGHAQCCWTNGFVKVKVTP